MDSKAGIINSIRNMAISRRGGVKTRGGRLPPIRIRELEQVTGNKKVMAPNIPQRRKTVKEEPQETSSGRPIQTGPSDDFQNSRGRGRGRQPKVYLQTEGAFLAEGPALKIKKDPTAYESFSSPRVSRANVSENSVVTFDADIIEELLESSGGEETFEDVIIEMRPYRLPPVRKKPARKIRKAVIEDDDDVIKKEIKAEFDEDDVKRRIKIETDDDDVKRRIKIEPDDDDIKRRIKIEPDDDDIKRIIKIEPDDDNGIKKEIKKEPGEDAMKIKKEKSENEDDELTHAKEISFERENELKAEVKKIANQIQDMKAGNEMMVLLQIPSYTSSASSDNSEGNSKRETQGLEPEPEETLTFIDNLEEGCIGKLRIMKSGEMKMQIGSIEFEVMEGHSITSYWEVVSIRLQDEGGDLAVLGKIEKKMTLCPVTDILLSKEKVSHETEL